MRATAIERLILTVTASALVTGGGPAFAGPGPRQDGGKKDEEKVKLADKDEAFQKRVNEAVARGVEALAAKALPDGSWPREHDTTSGHGPFPHGSTALALYALLKSGFNRFDERIEKGFKFLQERWTNFKAGGKPHGGPTAWHTYEAGITLMALEALDHWRPATQKHEGTVAVGANIKPAEREWAKELRDYLVENHVVTREVPTGGGKGGGAPGMERKKECWHYPSSMAKATDHSNTQYAVLGLRAATKLGFPSPAATWIGVVEGFIFTQAADGDPVARVIFDPKAAKEGYVKPHTVTSIKDRARGWGYHGAEKPQKGTGQMAETGSMTTVGIACVAIGWNELENLANKGDKDAARFLKDKYKEKETSIMDGMAWLAKNWTVTENPNYKTWHFYYVYGLERAAILTGTSNIGAHDWYREGGEMLLGKQAGGIWDDGNGDATIPSTAFALLFLLRATVPLRHLTGH